MNIENKNSMDKINNMLNYSVAALSIVSFLTTLNGLNGIVSNNKFTAGLISFSIQSIILILGLKFLDVCNVLKKIMNNFLLKAFLILCIILLYLSSVLFSSFFSFVFLTNAAYYDVGATDYNIELENFLVEETTEIKNINDVIGKVLLQRIQEEAPNFKDLLNTYKKNTSDKIKAIIKKSKEYTESKIPDKYKFDSDKAIETYEGVNGTGSANESLKSSCESLKDQVNAYIDFYNDQYYPYYKNLYDELKKEKDSTLANNRIQEISEKVKEIEQQKEKLNEISHFRDSINKYVKNTCNNIATYYDRLAGALNEISNTYNQI